MHWYACMAQGWHLVWCFKALPCGTADPGTQPRCVPATGNVLLNFTSQVENWESYINANSIVGWTSGGNASACDWQHVSCNAAGQISIM